MISSGYENVESGEVWGIVGGMGPLASAEFVNTIYRDTSIWTEQDAPSVLLLSDPTVPDRSECLLSGQHEVLVQRLTRSVECLSEMGATKIIICCLTIHPLIPRLPAALRGKIVSLVELTIGALRLSRSRHLMLCTTGTRKLRLFQQHPAWQDVEHKVVFADDQDQVAIHQMLYKIKSQHEAITYVPFVEDLMRKYGVNSYIAGCTEMHILAKAHEQFSGHARRELCIDPLTEVLPLMQRSVLGPHETNADPAFHK
jgi:aspartate racemase